MSSKLIIAAPSKGRLQENTQAFFARAGMSLVQDGGNRNYRGAIRDMPDVEVLYLSASEIVAKLASGEVHFGVTGEDLVREAIPDPDSKVCLLAQLGFGQADVVVAVPKGWIDARTMEDLEEIAADFHARRGRRLRVATKYINITRRFFAEHGVGDYRIVESLGATEGAPAAGAAEIIVDITTTGSTLEANALKVLDDGVILRSQASLVASLAANWNDGTKRLARTALNRISAEQRARTERELRLRASAGRMSDIITAAAQVKGATLVSSTGTSAIFNVPASHAPAIADQLVAAGADHVSVGQLDYVFSQNSGLAEKLDQALA